MFSVTCAWINGWLNNREAGELSRNRAHYDVSIMYWYIVEVFRAAKFIDATRPCLFDTNIWPSTITEPLSHTHWCISELKLELSPRNVKIGTKLAIFLAHVPFQSHGWLSKIILRTPLEASLHSYIWIWTGVIALKRSNFKICFDLCDLELLQGHYFLSMVITPESVMMIRWGNTVNGMCQINR